MLDISYYTKELRRDSPTLRKFVTVCGYQYVSSERAITGFARCGTGKWVLRNAAV